MSPPAETGTAPDVLAGDVASHLDVDPFLYPDFHTPLLRHLKHQTARSWSSLLLCITSRGQLKCDGTRAETKFCLSAKRTSPFKLAGASVQSTTGS